MSFLDEIGGFRRIGQQREPLEQPIGARDLHAFERGEPVERLLQAARIEQFLFGRERVRIRMTARILGAGQISHHMRGPRRRIARQEPQAVVRKERGALEQSLSPQDERRPVGFLRGAQ